MMKIAKHYLLALALTGIAPAAGAFDLYVDTTNIALPEDSLGLGANVSTKIYSRFDVDAGHDGSGNSTGDLARSGLYECDTGTLADLYEDNNENISELLADTGLNPDGKLDIVEALRLAGSCLQGQNTIHLQEGEVYELSDVDNYWYGSNALPPVRSGVTIRGYGATIKRAASAPDMRLLHVLGALPFGVKRDSPSSPPEPNFTAPGQLTLEDIRLEGGLARGGAGAPGTTQGGGGAAGFGGAIYNRGQLTVNRSVFVGNQAVGGNAGDSGSGTVQHGAGGGLGGAADVVTGGGFFGVEFLGGEAGDDTAGGVSSVLFGCGDLTGDGLATCEEGTLGGSAASDPSAGGGGGAFGGGGTQSDAPSGEGGLGGGFVARDDPGENGGGWLVSATIFGGAGGVGGGGGPGATGGFGGGSGGGQTEAAFGGGVGGQGGGAYGGAIFNHGGLLKLTNNTFSSNSVEAGLDDDGSSRTNSLGGADIYSFNSSTGATANNLMVFNTFFQGDCTGDCSGESLGFQFQYGDGLARHPVSNPEDESSDKKIIQSRYTLAGNILDAQSGGAAVVAEVDTPGQPASNEVPQLVLVALNNLVPVGSDIDISGTGWDSDAVQCASSSPDNLQGTALLACGTAPNSGTLNLGALEPPGSAGFTSVHIPQPGSSAIDGVTENFAVGGDDEAVITNDQSGALRQCASGTVGTPDIGAYETRGRCSTPPELSASPSLLLNGAEHSIKLFEISDDEGINEQFTLEITSDNIASFDLPADAEDILTVTQGDPIVLEGRRDQIQQVMERASFVIDDPSKETASVSFSLEDSEGLVTEHITEIAIDTTPPELSLKSVPDLVTSREAFVITVVTSEPVLGFLGSQMQLVNGELLEVRSVSVSEFELTMRATGGGDGQQPVYFQFLQGAVGDRAGNENERSPEPFRIAVDITADEEESGRRGGGGSAALGPFGLILILAGAFRFRRNSL